MNFCEFDEGDLAKICEIAVIYGELFAQKKVLPFGDLYEAYEYFKKVYEDWSFNVDIQSEEERGYITAYANRVIAEKYGKK